MISEDEKSVQCGHFVQAPLGTKQGSFSFAVSLGHCRLPLPPNLGHYCIYSNFKDRFNYLYLKRCIQCTEHLESMFNIAYDDKGHSFL